MSERSSVRVVLGSWSCGSTAVAGYLARVGAYTAPPHQRTNDPRTPNSYEPRALREALSSRIDESSLQYTHAVATPFSEWFRSWIEAEQLRAENMGYRHVVIKHPMLAFFMEDIATICDPRFVVVTRRPTDIESTRYRRGWHSVYGQAGARTIYSHIFSALLDHSLDAVVADYERFCRDSGLRRRVTDWLGMEVDAEAEQGAARWLF